MRERIYRFMQGRYGMDDLAKAEIRIAWIPLLLSLFLRNNQIVFAVCDTLFLAILIHTYFRALSKNISRRYEENQKYLKFRYDLTVRTNKIRKRLEQRKMYCFFKCPMCKQEVRVPKGHGKIEITCPKCRERFIRRS